MLNALLIGNPASGSGHLLADLRLPGTWNLEPGTLTPTDLEGIELLALFGGDGTMQITLSQLLRRMPAASLPPIALMPFGTTNMNARDLHQVRGRNATVERLRQVIESGHVPSISRSLLRVVGGDEVQHGFFFGMGVIAQVVERWNAERSSASLTNQMRTLWAMITGLSNASSATRIELDGTTHSVYGLLVTTLNRLLFGARPYWGPAESADLRLTWVESDAPQLLRHAPALLRGKPRMADVPGYESRATDGLSLTLEGPWIIDGEIFRSAGETLTIAPSTPLHWVTL